MGRSRVGNREAKEGKGTAGSTRGARRGDRGWLDDEVVVVADFGVESAHGRSSEEGIKARGRENGLEEEREDRTLRRNLAYGGLAETISLTWREEKAILNGPNLKLGARQKARTRFLQRVNETRQRAAREAWSRWRTSLTISMRKKEDRGEV